MKQLIKNVVLVHGAFADGSGWEAVANILKNDGYTVAVVQHPETSFAEDIKCRKAVIDRQSGPVVLVGRSSRARKHKPDEERHRKKAIGLVSVCDNRWFP